MRGLLIILILFIGSNNCSAQRKLIKGYVKNGHSDEMLPFASVIFKNTNIGKTTDSSGAFSFEFSQWPSDTLLISSISYETFIFVIPPGIDTLSIVAELQAGKAIAEVVVKAKQKHSRGWYLWRNVVRNKDNNNIFKKDNFTYRVYNKLQVDINNINPERIRKSWLIKPFGKTLYNNIDTVTEDEPILPSFLAETISDYYFQKDPYKLREVIYANKVSGVANQSITKYMGGLYQNVVIYNNFIPVFDKKYVSPLSDNGDAYYNYRLADTQRVAGRKLLHLIFIPKRGGENTFEGDCWVHDSSFAIQKMSLHVGKEANINFLEELSVVQEFKMINDSTWFLSKDKFIVTLKPLGDKNTGFIARKTTNYDFAQVNTSAVTAIVAKNKLGEEIEVMEGARTQMDTFWQSSRLEPLSKTEEGIYKMIDTIQSSPSYRRYYNNLEFLTTGYRTLGKVEIGPWFNWISGDSLEGTRVRFDLGTTKKFNKHFYLHGYLAYGFLDQQYKWKTDVLWLIKRNPRQTLYASYSYDLSFAQNYYTEGQSSNILTVTIRKPDIPRKFLMLRETLLRYSRDTKFGLTGILTFRSRNYDPLAVIPGKIYYPTKTGIPLNTSEITFRLRYAYVEKFLETTFNRFSFGSDRPIADIEFSQGFKNVLQSSYTYQKLAASVRDQISISPFGSLEYLLYGGKVFGTLPYLMLQIHAGNEVYYYNKYAYNLMEQFQYVSDTYGGFAVENNFGSGIFRFIPFTRKLKFRQFWNLKGVIGSTSSSNKELNNTGVYNFQYLDNKMYLEIGTGVENIFRFLRLDFVWRLSPTPLPEKSTSRFGIFGSFKLQL